MSDTNQMVITDIGESELANPSAGGLYLTVTTFKVGTGTTLPTKSDVGLESEILSLSTITNIQVTVDQATGIKSAYFTLYMDTDIVGVTSDLTINEVGIFMPSGAMFARGVFTTPLVKPLGIAIQIVAVVASLTCDLTVLDVTVSSASSLPSLPYLRTLPPASGSLQNVVAVLDLKLTPNGVGYPGVVVKYGAGGNRWGYIGYNLIYEGNIDLAGFTALPTVFKIASLSSVYEFANQEKLICQVISGAGSGQSRRLKYNESLDMFEECENKAFSPQITPTGSTASIVAIWRASETPAVANPIPALPYDHPDYVLKVGGTDGPKWLPETGSMSASSAVSLYYPPSRLVFKTYSWTSDGRDSFAVPSFSSVSTSDKPPEDICYTFVTVQGILQIRQSYELVRREYTLPNSSQTLYEFAIRFSEAPPLYSEVELWYAYHDVDNSSANSPGARILAKTFTLGENLIQSGDRRFMLTDGAGGSATDIPDSAEFLFVVIGSIKQHSQAYIYQPNGSPNPYIEFNEKPPAGVPIEVTTLLQKSVPGTREATLIINNDFLHPDNDVSDIELSDYPTPANAGETVNSYVFVNVSGVVIHRNRYTVIGNRILFSNMIAKGRPIGVTILKNITVSGTSSSNIEGVVTGALMSLDNLLMLRHGTMPVSIPIPRVNLTGRNGILVDGSYPDLVLSYSPTSSSSKIGNMRHSMLHTQDDVEEVIYTYRVSYTSAVMAMLTCDFSARLGPGFMTTHGRELIQFSIGIRSGAGREPDYGRHIKGTGEAGFCYMGHDADYAYSNASLSDIFEFIPDNLEKGGYVDIVARMRVQNASVAESGSNLRINFNLIVMPL